MEIQWAYIFLIHILILQCIWQYKAPRIAKKKKTLRKRKNFEDFILPNFKNYKTSVTTIE